MKEYHVLRSYFDEQTCLRASYFNAEYISQNSYIFCQLYGLKAISRAAAGNEKALKELYVLEGDYHLILAQTVGY